MPILLTLLLSLLVLPFASAYAPVAQLLQIHSSTISQLKLDPRTSPLPLDPPLSSPDLFYLRHILEYDEGIEEDDEGGINLLSGIQNTLSWRRGDGLEIVMSASSAIEEARKDGGWNNEPVLTAAPHSLKITNYITGKQIITTSSKQGDLIYCIRAGSIDDNSLMSTCTVPELIEFFLYAKEINTQIADERSLLTGRYTRIITANDLSGVNVFGDASFRKALSASSTIASKVYPAVNGPTLLLNLPKLLSALVKLFKPIFPVSVQKKLRFAQGPLKGIGDLSDVARGGEVREKFLKEIEELIKD